MASTIPFSEARARLTDLVDEVEQKHEHIVITRNGRPAVVVLSSDEYEALQETLEILDDEETMEALRTAAKRRLAIEPFARWSNHGRLEDG